MEIKHLIGYIDSFDPSGKGTRLWICLYRVIKGLEYKKVIITVTDGPPLFGIKGKYFRPSGAD